MGCETGWGLRGIGVGLIFNLWPRGAVSVTVSIWISRWVVGDGPVLLQARVRLIGTVVVLCTARAGSGKFAPRASERRA